MAFNNTENKSEFKEVVLTVRRVTNVVKGGRRFSFAALMAVGNENGKIGIGYGKAREVPSAIKKAIEQAKKSMFDVTIVNTTVPHPLEIKRSAVKLIIKPARKGTGIIAGNIVRAILEAAGYKNILSKIIGSKNKLNVAHTVVEALKTFRTKEQIYQLRGKVEEESSSN
jgi:small subunit ribosomal protein S5